MRWVLRLLPFVTASISGAELGDARRGKELLEDKRCVTCHKFGPRWTTNLPAALARILSNPMSPPQLTAEMWNHAPVMWNALRSGNIAFPSLSESQAADLLAYFFAAGYFDPPGEPARGERVFTQQGCHVCHLADSKEGGGPAVSKWEMANPTDMLQGMWSHWPAMKQAMDRRRMVWPALSTNDMRDLLAFVRSKAAEGQQPDLRPGSAENGKKLFESKGCAKCHAEGREAESVTHNLTELAASFWNHIPMMMREPSAVSRQEMADIVAYLWSVRYFEELGSAKQGRKVFAAKRCNVCHATPGRTGFNSAAMIGALWKHDPAVMENFRQKGIPWPRFVKTEMEDILAFLGAAAAIGTKTSTQ